MAQKISRRQLKHDEFVEAGLDAGQWLEKHWRSVALVAGVLVSVGVLFAGWSWWQQSRLARAGGLAAEGFGLLSPTDTSTPPNPVAAADKFREAAQTAGNSPLAKVARTYQGVALLRQGKAAEAVPILESVADTVSDPVLGGTARALLADALDTAGNPDRAAEVLRGLADAADASYPPELALMRLGEVRARQGKADEARRVWEEVLSRFPESPAAAQARDRMSRIAADSLQ